MEYLKQMLVNPASICQDYPGYSLYGALYQDVFLSSALWLGEPFNTHYFMYLR